MIPDRPRLSERVRARRHRVRGRVLVTLHDEGRVLELGAREWDVLRHADGTRDLAGIRLAAQRAGVRVGSEEAERFFGRLMELDLLDDSELREEPARGREDLPIAPLPGYRFRCDGRGACCSIFDTILFTPLEVARARVTLPQVEADFMPEHGVDSPLCAASRQEGACTYLNRDRLCGLHAAGGALAKPFGCRTFPTRFLDVGIEIRAFPRPECACVFGAAQEGQLTEAIRGGDLAPETFVPSLPARIAMGPELVAAADVLHFGDALAPHGDRAVFSWNLAHQIAREGRAAIASDTHIDPPTLRGALATVSASIDRLAQLSRWRAPNDLAQTALGWIAEAVLRLLTDDSMPPPHEEDEALYLRIATFGVLGTEHSVERELRQRAVAMWIARAFPAEAREHPKAAHPIALVEAMARGHGLELS